MEWSAKTQRLARARSRWRMKCVEDIHIYTYIYDITRLVLSFVVLNNLNGQEIASKFTGPKLDFYQQRLGRCLNMSRIPVVWSYVWSPIPWILPTDLSKGKGGDPRLIKHGWPQKILEPNVENVHVNGNIIQQTNWINLGIFHCLAW